MSSVDGWKTHLSKLYSTPGESAAFSSAEKLYAEMKKQGLLVTRADIQNWLDNTYSYAIHRNRTLNFKRNPIIAQYPDHNWQADILFLQDIAGFNDNKPCILICIDVISRYAWAEPMRSKKGADTAKAFQTILLRAKRTPEKLQTDKGSEFYNSHFRALLNKHNIRLYSTESDKKAAIAERCIKEVKKLLYRFMDFQQTNRYIDHFQSIMETYNSTKHKSIGMAPKDVNETTLSSVLDRLYSHLWQEDNDEKRKKFKVGDKVRISISTKFFTKGYKGFWSSEIFVVNAVKRYYPHAMYQLRDSDKEIVKGLFYDKELQLVKPGSERYTKIKQIIRRKFIKGKLWYLVNWENESPSTKRWIPADTLYEK